MGICPRCGRPSKNNELCESCRIELQGVRYKKFKITQCSICKKVLYRNKWLSPDIAIPRIVKERIMDEWELASYNLGKQLELILRKNNYESLIVVPIVKTVCATCSKKRGDYYEAILQVRGKGAVEIMEKIKNRQEIYKEVSHKTGKDYYYFFSRNAKQVARELKKRIRGTITITRKLHGYDKQRSKKIYRLTILFRQDDL